MGLVTPFLPYGRQLIEDDDVAAVAEQLRSGQLTQGPTVERFEQALCAATGAPYAVAVSSGTAALHLACLAAGLQPGDTGVTADITFVASANCMRYAGATPVLVDVDPATALLSTEALEAAVSRLAAEGKPPKVIIPVDFAGAVAPLEAVARIARRVGATVIEDAAHALGASYTTAAGQVLKAGSCHHSDLAILSFHPVKHITTGEGGAIVTSSELLYRRLLELRTHGITKDPARLQRNDGPWSYEQQALGFNYRLTDLQCALGVSQAKKLDRFVARRRALAARYDDAFRAARFRGVVAPLAVPADVHSSFHLYVVRVRPEQRRALYDGLRARGIGPQVHYIPVHLQPDFVRAGLATGAFPGADAYYAGCLSLPLFPAMADSDIDRVVEAVGASLGVAAP